VVLTCLQKSYLITFSASVTLKMTRPSLLLLASALGAVAQLPDFIKEGPGCTTLPKEVNLGPAVPMRAQDIPSGCADLEVLVGS
jgi:hypothetical protein